MIPGAAERYEPGRYYTFESRLPQGEFFELRPHHLPRNAQPILDETSGICIGYTVVQAPGLWQVYDTHGHFVRLEEAPLETPLIDPTDIALLAFVSSAFSVLVAPYLRLVQELLLQLSLAKAPFYFYEPDLSLACQHVI